ncbi:DNA-binding response regulator [Bacillaceae bacterium SAS-127]|nr:DNA-binding response regulator [Bacillaceae bacterium SAS-127]
MIRIMIVDDQSLIRDGLCSNLNRRKEIEVVDTAKDGEEAVQRAVESKPDLVLMDIRMPTVDGVEGMKLIKKHIPEIKVVMLTTFNDKEWITEALEEGASGYLLKDMPTDAIVQAMMTVHQGGIVLPQQFTQPMLEALRQRRVHNEKEASDIAQQMKQLTARETEVLKELGLGKNNREIADALVITEGTVKNHISNVIQKLELRDRTQAAVLAIRSGLVTFPT